MNGLQIKSNPDVATVFNNYPDFVQGKMRLLREVVIKTAQEIKKVSEIEASLKYGAIIFTRNDELLKEELKKCIKAALTYHKVIHLETLEIEV